MDSNDSNGSSDPENADKAPFIDFTASTFVEDREALHVEALNAAVDNARGPFGNDIPVRLFDAAILLVNINF